MMGDKEIINALESLYAKILDAKYDMKITRKEFTALNTSRQTIIRQSLQIDSLQKANKAQTEEIERLRYNLKAVLEERADHTEAIKEFAERLKESVTHIPWCDYPPVQRCIDDAVKETVGEEG